MKLERIHDAAHEALREPDSYLIKGLLDDAAFSVIYGDANSGKTFIALDMAFRVASGLPFEERKVKHGLVIYVSAEGGKRIKRRLAALIKKYADENAPRALFSLLNYSIDLRSNGADLCELIKLIKAEEAELNAKCVWVIVDTLARAMNGGDENSPVDMGKIVSAADRIRDETGAHFTYIHHTGKDAARGARGHSLLRAATDTEIEVASNQVRTTKQRDMECNFALGFDLADIPIGTDPNGEPVKSAIVNWRPLAGENRLKNKKRPVPMTLRLLMDTVEAALDEAGKKIRPFQDGPLIKAAPDKTIRARYYVRIAEKAEDGEDPDRLAERQRKNFNNAIKLALDRKDLMAGEYNNERWIWFPYP
jgi:hypothetical protein